MPDVQPGTEFPSGLPRDEGMDENPFSDSETEESELPFPVQVVAESCQRCRNSAWYESRSHDDGRHAQTGIYYCRIH